MGNKNPKAKDNAKSDIGENYYMEKSQGDPIVGTSAEPNRLQCAYSVGKKGYVKTASPGTVEGLRPAAGEMKDG